jgi:phosphotransferase system IIB component
MVATHRAKKTATTINDKLTVSTKINFDVQELINVCGGKQNIVSCSATISSVTIVFKQDLNFQKEMFAKFKIRGLIKASDRITILFGDSSLLIAEQINTFIKSQV